MTDKLLSDLIKAVFADNTEDVRRLMDAGATAMANPKEGNSLMRTACQGHALGAMRVMLEQGVDPNERITYTSPVDGRVEADYTPLMYASTAAAVDLLVSFGADVNAVSATGLSALMCMAHFGVDDAVQALLRHGADASLRQYPRAGKKALTALELIQEKLAVMESILPDSPKPEAKAALERYRRTFALLNGVKQS